MGRVVVAAPFSDEEAIGYVRSLLDPATGGPAPLAHAGDADIRRLARAVAHHPLGLSIAAKTIVTWHLAWTTGGGIPRLRHHGHRGRRT